MLISPKNKFIYFKPMKVAGSSIEKSLLNICSGQALCTGGLKYPEPTRKKRGLSKKETTEYDSINNLYEDENGNIWSRFHPHTWPSLFKGMIKDFSIFKDYKKITSVRNPWEQIVSYYWWDMFGMNDELSHALITEKDSASKAKKKFHIWAHTMRLFDDYSSDELKNKTTPIEFMSSVNEMFLDEMITDYIIYENLQNDYGSVVRAITNQENNLPKLEKLKSGIKKINRHYSFYYDYSIKEWTEKSFKKTIKKFDYSFVKE